MQCRSLKAVLLAGIDVAVSEDVDMGVEVTKRIDGKASITVSKDHGIFYPRMNT
jgi:hypothetical protein